MTRKILLPLAGGAAVALSVTLGALNAQGSTGDWHKIGDGMTEGVSGIAPMGKDRSLIVRDNKEPGQNRVAEVTHEEGQKPQVRTLTWKGSPVPKDLEALDAVPGAPGDYIAVASEGKGYRIHVSGDTAQAAGDGFALPGLAKGANIENFALTSQHGRLAAVWGDRGDGKTPATLYAAPIALGKGGKADFGDVTKQQLSVPYPEKNVRHASDTKITDDGRLLVSSASDPGDDGPFDSAVYDAGTVKAEGGSGIALDVSEKPELVKKFAGHKIEALSCPDGGKSENGILGTDDENGGGSLTTAPVCGG
ncbi:hypothetical protein [Streptomyces sp. ODS28]|uniref:hypothetical protein n=1 Tax=Streptomyces sp. ODS28 TaxID=3136688 RepID=UPI0031EFC0A0